MSYSREVFFVAVLAGAGQHSPSQFVKDFGVAWSKYETAGPPAPSAAYNPYNTIQDEPGATFFNTFGPNGEFHVKNYPDFVTGVRATFTALTNGHYPHLLAALRNNDEAALKGPNPAIAAELGTWGTGHFADIAHLAESMSDALRNEQLPGTGPNLDQDSPVVKSIEDLFNQCESAFAELRKTVLGVVEPGKP